MTSAAECRSEAGRVPSKILKKVYMLQQNLRDSSHVRTMNANRRICNILKNYTLFLAFTIAEF
jgi:hypothetical protein